LLLIPALFSNLKIQNVQGKFRSKPTNLKKGRVRSFPAQKEKEWNPQSKKIADLGPLLLKGRRFVFPELVLPPPPIESVERCQAREAEQIKRHDDFHGENRAGSRIHGSE
jgi:hypothetical protein